MSGISEQERLDQEKKVKKLLTDEQVLDMFIKLARAHNWPAFRQKQSK